jgi:hypothetical protein
VGDFMRPTYLYIPIFIVAYTYNLLWALDILGNAIIGGSRLTISADCWNAYTQDRLWGKMVRPIIDGIFRIFGEKDHCQRAWELNGVRRINAPKLMAKRWMKRKDFIYPGRI